MIAITGALGFIGSNLVQRLSVTGCELLLIDRPLAMTKSRNLLGLSRYRFSADSVFLDELRANEFVLDAVFHLGACSSTTETDWDYLLRNNVNFSQEIWTWWRKRAMSLLLRVKRGDVWRRIAGIRRSHPAQETSPAESLWQKQERFRSLGADPGR